MGKRWNIRKGGTVTKPKPKPGDTPDKPKEDDAK